MQDFISNNWLTMLVAVVGLLTSYTFYLKSRTRSALTYARESFQLNVAQSKLSSEIKISFRGKELDSITKTLVFIWNSGNSTIEGNRIVAADPLRINTSEGSEILDATVSSVSRQVNSFEVKEGRENMPNELLLNFDFLDPNDGAIIEILHTGNEEAIIVGTLRGLINIFAGKRPEKKSLWATFGLMVLFIITAILVGAFVWAVVIKNDKFIKSSDYLLFFSFLLVSAFSLRSLLGRLRSRPPKFIVSKLRR